MMRKPTPSPIANVRRTKQARRRPSPRAGSRETTARRPSKGTTSTSPSSNATAVKNSVWPVSRLSSPRNRPGPCTRTTLLVVRAVSLHHRHATGQDDIERLTGITLGVEHFAGVDGSSFAVRLQFVQLGLIQPGLSPFQIGSLGQRSRLGQ